MAKKEPPPSGKKPLVLTGAEAEEVCAALEYERELDEDELRRAMEISKYPLSVYERKKLPPLPGKDE